MAIEYLNNRAFTEIIIRFNAAKLNNKIEDFKLAQIDLANALYVLASNIIKAFKFQLVDRDDALQEGVLICFEKVHKFDPNKGRAFNFCTTIILNHYKQLYRYAKNHNEFKAKYRNFLSDKDPYLKVSRNKKSKFKFFPKEDCD